jgi:hypothetical protein
MVTIQLSQFLRWWPKFFKSPRKGMPNVFENLSAKIVLKHPTYPHHKMVTKFFRSPLDTHTIWFFRSLSNTATPSNLTNRHYYMMTNFFWFPWKRGGGAYHMFLESPCRSLFKNMWQTHPFVIIKKFQSPQNGMIEIFLNTTMLVTKNYGCHKVWQLKKFNRHIMWWPIFFF